ncbi:MAG: DeoR/GlpR transcriptional regulator [Firmicutes bacterium]|nr:DeoR/GlpR transcriptional regulator [Bacillota bacterium]
MLPAERRQRILELIQHSGSATVEELAEAVGSSSSTVRRDLDRLAALSLVIRTHGGAVLPTHSTAYEKRYTEKRSLRQHEKARIGKAAAEFVQEGETVILDSGSTTLEVARNLAAKKHLTIITNDLFIATEITYHPSTTVIVTGGILRPGFNVVVGSATESFLMSVHVDKSFLGGDAVDFDYGLTNATLSEASVKQLMIKAAREAYLVVDHTKFGQRALAKVADLESFKLIVTDHGLSPRFAAELERRSLNYLQV